MPTKIEVTWLDRTVAHSLRGVGKAYFETGEKKNFIWIGSRDVPGVFLAHWLEQNLYEAALNCEAGIYQPWLEEVYASSFSRTSVFSFAMEDALWPALARRDNAIDFAKRMTSRCELVFRDRVKFKYTDMSTPEDIINGKMVVSLSITPPREKIEKYDDPSKNVIDFAEACKDRVCAKCRKRFEPGDSYRVVPTPKGTARVHTRCLK